jgi:hypothetical protein
MTALDVARRELQRRGTAEDDDDFGKRLRLASLFQVSDKAALAGTATRRPS